jgi:1-deoxy-D-xylulose-5-phosphate reductoisomerase
MEVSVERLDLAAVGQLSFEAPDPERFPTLRIAREALGAGGGAPTVLNAANEVAVEKFLAGKLGFLDIAKVVESTLEAMPTRPPSTIEDVWALNCEARRLASGIAEKS